MALSRESIFILREDMFPFENVFGAVYDENNKDMTKLIDKCNEEERMYTDEEIEPFMEKVIINERV